MSVHKTFRSFISYIHQQLLDPSNLYRTTPQKLRTTKYWVFIKPIPKMHDSVRLVTRDLRKDNNHQVVLTKGVMSNFTLKAKHILFSSLGGR